MAKAPKKADPNRPAIKTDAATTCYPPAGQALGEILWWDGFNWQRLAYPNPANGQHLIATPTGPAWANV